MGCRREKGWVSHGQGASGVPGGGCRRAECQSTAKLTQQPHRGEVREGELPAWMFCCINGLEMSRDSSARGDTGGTLAPAHIMRIERMPATGGDFHLSAVFFALH